MFCMLGITGYSQSIGGGLISNYDYFVSAKIDITDDISVSGNYADINFSSAWLGVEYDVYQLQEIGLDLYVYGKGGFAWFDNQMLRNANEPLYGAGVGAEYNIVKNLSVFADGGVLRSKQYFLEDKKVEGRFGIYFNF